MKKILLVLLKVLVMSVPLFSYEIITIEGKQNQVCRDYKDNMKSKFVNTKVRIFKDKYTSKYLRPKWKKIKLLDENMTLFKRIYSYANKGNQYTKDNLTNKEFFRDYFVETQNHFFYTKMDIDFDGNEEILIRHINDGVPLNELGHSKVFTIIIVVVDEKQGSVNLQKTKLLQHLFSKHFWSNNAPSQNMRTDTNIFIFKGKVFLDTYWSRLLINPNLNPLIQVVELTELGKKEACLFELEYRKGNINVK